MSPQVYSLTLFPLQLSAAWMQVQCDQLPYISGAFSGMMDCVSS